MGKKAFTLIEILTTLIIIGVLASIALPRYMGAMERMKAAEGIEVLKKVLSAQKVYRLEHPAYATDINDLDIDIETFGNPSADKLKYFDWNDVHVTDDPAVNPLFSSSDALVCVDRKEGVSDLYTLCMDTDSNIECYPPLNSYCERLGNLNF